METFIFEVKKTKTTHTKDKKEFMYHYEIHSNRQKDEVEEFCRAFLVDRCDESVDSFDFENDILSFIILDLKFATKEGYQYFDLMVISRSGFSLIV